MHLVTEEINLAYIIECYYTSFLFFGKIMVKNPDKQIARIPFFQETYYVDKKSH